MKKLIAILLFTASYNNLFYSNNSYYKKEGESWFLCKEINDHEAICANISKYTFIASILAATEKELRDGVSTLLDNCEDRHSSTFTQKRSNLEISLSIDDKNIQSNLSKEEQEKGNSEFAKNFPNLKIKSL